MCFRNVLLVALFVAILAGCQNPLGSKKEKESGYLVYGRIEHYDEHSRRHAAAESALVALFYPWQHDDTGAIIQYTFSIPVDREFWVFPGVKKSETYTDEHGYYSFSNVKNGLYSVGMIATPKYPDPTVYGMASLLETQGIIVLNGDYKAKQFHYDDGRVIFYFY